MKLTDHTGTIILKEPKKVYNKDSPFYGNLYYKLKVLTTEGNIHTFFVYENIVSSPLWKAIVNSHYADKRYLFCGERKQGKKGLILHSWQELNSKFKGGQRA